MEHAIYFVAFVESQPFFSGKKEIVLPAEAASEEGLDLQLTAALGTKWAHAVNIRLVLESISGIGMIVSCQHEDEACMIRILFMLIPTPNFEKP